MKANLNLGSVSGIKIKIHWTFFFLIVWVAFNEVKEGGTTESVFYNIAFVLAVFVCVVLHELGHALTAKRFGINTKNITLLPIGGMARLDKIPASPKEEFLVTIAGPLVNIVIALLLYFVIPYQNLMHLSLGEEIAFINSFTLQNFLIYLFFVNIGLVVFNLIPAFPMDGGRILRALLAMKLDRVKATKIASSIGLTIAVMFLLIGLLYNPILIFIALFVFIGAYTENLMVKQLSLLKGHKVKDVMLTSITKFNSENSIQDVIDVLLAGSENNFVVVDNDKIVGLLYHKDIIEKSKERALKIKEIMKTSFKTIDINADINEVYRLIYSDNKPFLPVVDKNKLIGAIDLANINEFFLLQAKLAY